jgi:hypothetical protein
MSYRSQRRLSFIFAGCVAIIAAGPVWCQSDDEKPRVLFARSPDDLDNAALDLVLRPNPDIKQKFFVFLHNPLKVKKRMQISLQTADGRMELAKGGPVDVAPGGTQLVPVAGGKPAPPMEPANGSGKPAPAPELPTLVGPRVFFQVVLTDGEKELEKRRVGVNVQMPAEYLRATSTIGGPRRALSVKIEALQNFWGPRCPVELDLSRLPGVILPKDAQVTLKDGVEKGALAELNAEGLRSRLRRSVNGLVMVRADGYDRAFVFETTFDNQGETGQPQLLRRDRPTLRLVTPGNSLYSLPAKDFKIGVEVDNPPRANVEIELAIDRSGTGDYRVRKVFKGDREHLIRVNARTDDGSVEFIPQIQDWSFVEDMTGALRPCRFRARLLDPLNNHVPLTVVGEGRPDEIVKTVVFSDLKPELPALTTGTAVNSDQGSTLPVTVEARDSKTGIREVKVVVGSVKVMKDKLPEDVEAKPLDPPADSENGNGTWSGNVAITPEDKPATLTIEVTNFVGLTRVFQKTVRIGGAGGGAPGDKPAIIKGTVFDENDDQQHSKELKIFLSEGMKKEAADSANLDDDGVFTFKDVAPGTYRVSCKKETTGHIASTSVTVKAGETKTVKLTLKAP